ncbi:TadE/TadG family type IV pilus assembly protein [Arthrobacter sp. H14]|uniref:TadE/TadG family type IV pilus assembly protein n=1 Tax=Arthrobacter sp. H14 TaxID=1312959 RepID=UPI00047CD6B1|nr:TadE/TadG family type IV pilus assembly protein [Arthrobacter sp. H14]
MRRITRAIDDERGAASVIVAILMVALLGFAALVIDVGLMYAEKAQLQNGADAEALSIAQSCAEDAGDALCSETSPLATTFADQNANDGLTNIDNVALDQDAGTVTVITGAEEAGGDENSVSLFFANALGIPSAEVRAQATAEWGSPVEGTAPFPVAFSICQLVEETGELQLFVSHGDDADASCEYGPSGHVVPGGFGKLPQQEGECSADINVIEEYAESSPGNDAPPNCGEVFASWKAQLTAGDPPTELFPIFDDVDDSVTPAQFSLIGFAAVEIHGWYFSSEAFHNTSAFVGDAACTGNCRGVIGKFVEMVSLEDGYGLGPVIEDLDTTVVHLTLGDEE